ncbi:DUF998 domain-containing protein [Actinoplanes couchii]|uniref:DUF998 domain-containing protein n=1 Tax=Actinoplanes couchii TaxID=403638 RepID=A0ABQ3XLU8_9ACTN|nr:DUF998 domain-containing protein [Actinoplanes couchii]MDR6319312.1 putative membrane protein [Actinoplanes couchii]GID59479.1 hypothetical protein Aco03nite_078830 [Actinoplanes couchii]
MNLRFRVGAWCWTAAAPLFLVVNVVVGWRWRDPGFSWAVHNVSDLGNVGCGVWAGRAVCSPWHAAMNTGMLVTALLLLAGAFLLTRYAWDGNRCGFVLLVLAGTGLGVAALFPADVNENAHVQGAVLLFIGGNVGLIVTGLSRRARYRRSALGLGVLGLVATVLHLAGVGLGLGVGGMERVALAPLLVWTCVVGTLVAVTPAADPG